MSEIDACLDHNLQYSASFTEGELAARPSRRMAIVACMDARLDPARCLGLQEGDAHVIRNGGGRITTDVIRSLAISQSVLGTREVMLIVHTDCGLLASSEEELRTAIEDSTGTRPDFAVGAFADLEEQLRDSVAELKASPFIPHKEAIRGFVYEVETGRLREVRR